MNRGITVEQALDIRREKGLESTKLQKMRVSRNLSQNQLSVISGVPVRTIQHFECRRRSIDGCKLETLLDFCIALKCKIVDIIESEDTILKFEQVDNTCKI